MSDAPRPGDTTALPQLGRYQLMEKLGEGGMGQVFLAHDQRLDRRVAVKVLPEGSVNDPGAVARFRREAKALAQLSHPGIIQAHDSEEADGRHFLVMEFVEGQSLAALLKEKGRLTPAVAADYAHQAALALQHAHEKGLVHRDVKPSNLLLMAGGQVKVLDLGLARFLQDQVADPARTREGTGMGTPDYAAPEQFRDAHKADVRSDVYSLGCTLFQLLTGQVPFPGSSFSEKYEAHAHKPPPPIEELCPDVPAGLTLAVQKMLAKRPADRFQSAAEVAEALAPFVASSSASLQSIRNTSDWEGGRLTVRDWRLRRRHLLPWAVAGFSLAVTVAVVMAVIMFGPRWFGGQHEKEGDQSIVQNKGQDRPADNAGGGKQAEKPRPDLQPKTQPDDPNVLTVSQKEEGGGKYRTLGAALKDVKRGQTIRVLDNAVYRESLALAVAGRYDGITLEAVRGATLETPTPTNLIEIEDVRDVTVRGFRLRDATNERRDNTRGADLVFVQGACPGLLLERLEGETNRKGSYNGVTIMNTRSAATNQPPAIIRNCTFREAHLGVYVKGANDDGSAPYPAGRIVVRDNLIVNPSLDGICLQGALFDVHVVGNRIWNAAQTGVRLFRLFSETKGILVANNTVCNSLTCCALQDDTPQGKDIQVRNNLFLTPQRTDMVFLAGAVRPGDPLRGQDGKLLHKAWRLGHNWREARPPRGEDPFSRGWVPPTEDDVLQPRIDGVNRDPKALDHFLRPEKASDLATKGAGQTDPSLPSYVGALPPEGVEPWDWDRTWRMPAGAKLLTVSKEPSGGGTYRTINAALKDAKPWATVRVLDAATYSEPLVLDDPKKHEGIALDAVRGATLAFTGNRPMLAVKDVPSVWVRGFRFREEDPRRDKGFFVLVSGRSPSVVLERLDLRATGSVLGIVLHNVQVLPQQGPVVVRGCTVEGGRDGIVVLSGASSSGISIHDNRITGTIRGIQLEGGLAHCQVAGNLVWNSRNFGVQMEDLKEGSEHVLIANNTILGCGCDLCLWDNEPYKKYTRGQVEVYNNLLAEATEGDALFIHGVSGNPAGAGDVASLIKLWPFACNCRDQSGTSSKEMIPLSPRDRLLQRGDLASREPSHPDFLRPPADSPLATAGVGDRNPSLPAYVGALAPKGSKPWDWSLTWRSRAGNATSAKDSERP